MRIYRCKIHFQNFVITICSFRTILSEKNYTISKKLVVLRSLLAELTTQCVTLGNRPRILGFTRKGGFD